MKQLMFTIRDTKADAYLPPFFLPKKEMAARVFDQCVNSEDHQFGKWPADYTLFHIGTFNDETGICITYAPESLGNGLEYLRPGKANLQPDLYDVEKTA